MLDDRKLLAIQHLAEGEKTRSDIAGLVGVSRQTIYDWLNDEEFRAELDKRLAQRKSLVENIIDSKLMDMTNQLANLIVTTKNDRVKAQSLQYWIDRGLGKTANKVEVSAQPTTTTVDNDLLGTAYEHVNEDVIDHDDNDTQ